MAEVTLRPQLSIEEIEAARQAVAFELETLAMRPEQETILMDMIHSVSFVYVLNCTKPRFLLILLWIVFWNDKNLGL